MLYGLAALAGPVLIHLLHRQRVVQVPFSTLRFLKAVAARTSRRSRLENVLLFLLRCGIVALLVLAAAQPVVSPKAAAFLGGDVPRTVVLIVDHSMSMGYRVGERTRLDLAREQALTILNGLKSGDRVAVLAVNDRVRLLIAEPTVDHSAARNVLQDIRPTEARTDFSGALQEAQKLLDRSARGSRQVYLLTDNQATGWAFDAPAVFGEAWRSSEAQLTVVRSDSIASANAAVKAVRLKAPPLVTPGTVLRGLAVVENFSSVPRHDVLEVEIGGERVAQSSVEVGADSAVEVPFEFRVPATARRFLEGAAKLQGDNLPADDRFVFLLTVYQAPRVLVVEGQQVGSDSLHSGFFLRKALGVASSSGSAAMVPRVISTAELDETGLEDFATVFLTDVGRLGDRAVARLNRYLENGGTVVFLPGDRCSVESLARMEFLPAKPTRLCELPAGRLAARVMEPTHPLLAGTWDADTPFPALPQQRMFEWQMGRDARVLIALGNEVPFLIEGRRGSGRVLVINASADRAWGDFPLSPAFLPLVQQIVRWSTEGTAAPPAVLVGDVIPSPPKLPRDRAFNRTGPDGKLLPPPAGEKGVLVERAEQSGFYKVSLPNGEVVQEFAVNVDPRESNLRPIEPAALGKMISTEVVTGLEDLKLWLGRNRGLVPLWPFLLVLAFLVFAAEAVLANLLARDRSQADEQHIRTGRLNKRRMGTPFRSGISEAEE